jgi:hypothetical protein
MEADSAAVLACVALASVAEPSRRRAAAGTTANLCLPRIRPTGQTLVRRPGQFPGDVVTGGAK